MSNTTEETLSLIFVHDVLVAFKILPQLSYIDLRVKMQTDNEFVDLLKSYKNIMELQKES